MLNDGVVEKNVEAALMNSRVSRRRSGDVPYPVEHTGASSSIFDVWDAMYQKTYCKGLTMHQFDGRHPAVVLDLGCGSGYWAIEAAKRWKNSTIVGYDVKNIQPRLFAFEQYKDIAHRIKWVHGNFLEGLPFSINHFDFVRISNIGLGVPEDEWQFVFEEVARVLKSGGIIEVIEEDPIFPCDQRAARICPPIVQNIKFASPLATNLPPVALSIKIPTTAESDAWIPPHDKPLERPARKSIIFQNPLGSSNSTNPSAHMPLMPGSETRQCPTHTPRALSVASEPDRTPDLRDHSKLKAAWEAMLASRFIASKPLSLIPFYLSFAFTEVQMRPPLKVALPPNSIYKSRPSSSSRSSEKSSADTSWYSASMEASDASTRSNRSESSATAPAPSGNEMTEACSSDTSPPASAPWANVHLASTLHKIVGCEEAIWQAYRKLYDTEIRTFVTHDEMSTNSCTRESFDDEWLSWKNDMTDRIGMRSEMMKQFQWPEPPGKAPDWHTWRSQVAKIEHAECAKHPPPGDNDSSIDPDSEDGHLCRSMRGFVACKP